MQIRLNSISVIQGEISQKEIFRHLLELYAYDFTSVWDFDIGENGTYGYQHLDLFWQETNYYPFLIYVKNKLAGFILIQKGLKQFNIVPDDNRWNVTELFILRKFRGKGIGQKIIQEIWKVLKGEWQVRVLKENVLAVKFWEKTITSFLKRLPQPEEQKVNSDVWLVYKFSS